MIADSRGYISTWNVTDLLTRFLTPDALPAPPTPGVYWRGHLAPIIKLRYVASSMTVRWGGFCRLIQWNIYILYITIDELNDWSMIDRSTDYCCCLCRYCRQEERHFLPLVKILYHVNSLKNLNSIQSTPFQRWYRLRSMAQSGFGIGERGIFSVISANIRPSSAPKRRSSWKFSPPTSHQCSLVIFKVCSKG